jgi:hypothetical protein
MTSTRPITSDRLELSDVLRSAVGLALCMGAAVMAFVVFQAAGDRQAILQAVATLDNPAAAEGEERARALARSEDALVRMAQRRTGDPGPPAALARLRIQQANGPGVDPLALLMDADRYAKMVVDRGGDAAEAFALRAAIALASGPPLDETAGALIRQSYLARAVDRRLGPERARLGLRMWADLDEAARAGVRQETCLVLRELPALAPELEAAAVEAEAPLLPSDLAEWRADPGCQAAS